jgi:hypothetical protein
MIRRTSAGNSNSGVTPSQFSLQSFPIRLIFVTPFRYKIIQLLLCLAFGRRPVNRFQIRSHPLALFPIHVMQTGSYHVHDAPLHARRRKHRLHRLRKPFRPSTQAMRMSLTPRFFSSSGLLVSDPFNSSSISSGLISSICCSPLTIVENVYTNLCTTL